MVTKEATPHDIRHDSYIHNPRYKGDNLISLDHLDKNSRLQGWANTAFYAYGVDSVPSGDWSTGVRLSFLVSSADLVGELWILISSRRYLVGSRGLRVDFQGSY